ncbi:MAG: 5'/3'-nucleotidase SurE [Flavobacteriaceae bacterium]|nr:5'/3'-nucleotidase SurE [Flavobacteriaceae bacterium]
MMEKPLILVTNDDGITAPGLRTLIHIMNEIGEVVVVAPDSPQSGMGHAITISDTLYCKKEKIDDGPQQEYSISGTPADCVKFAVREILNKKPDLCVSGINHGANSSINVIYSGTMSAAVEAGLEGIKSIGFSLLDYSWDADFSACKEYIRKISLNLLKEKKENLILNVNFPSNTKKFKGIKVCRQAKGYWEDTYDKRVSPLGKEYYWLTGNFVNQEDSKETDEWALSQGYVSLVPISFDMTSHQDIDKLKNWNLN